MAKLLYKNKILERGPESMRKRSRLFQILLAVISFLVFANTLQNGYAVDDVMVLKDNTIITQGISAVPELFTTPHLYGYSHIPDDTYRPLSLVLFAIEYQAFGLNPAANHFFNILIFIGCVLLLFRFLDELFEGKRTQVAFIAALIFAIHPVHTEVVANIKSCDELLSYFFGMLSLVLFMRYMRGGSVGQLLSGGGCLFLGLMAKESVITFMAVIPLVFFVYRNEHKRRAIVISGISAAFVAAFLLIRIAVLGKYDAGMHTPIDFTVNALAGAPIAERIATGFLVLGKYLKLMVLPYPLLCNYSYNSIPVVGFGDVWVLVFIVVYAAMAGIGIVRLVRNKKDPWAFGILFFLVTISLFSNFFLLLGAQMAERFVFFASTGFCLVVALVIDKFMIKGDVTIMKSPKVLGLLAALLLVFGGMTIARNSDWKNSITLYKADVQKSPEDCRLNYYVGTTLTHHNIEDAAPANARAEEREGMVYLYRAIAIYPEFSEVHAELGRLYEAYAVYDSAVKHNLAALAANPDNAIATYNLAREYYILKNYPGAIANFKRSIEFTPSFELAYLNLALCYSDYRQYDSAIVYFKKSLSLNGQQQGIAFKGMANAFRNLGHADSAVKYERYLGGN